MKALGIIFSNIHDRNVAELSKIRTMGSIPFGGRYRLIDFPLSNMVNSDINTVGIITKSNYQSLMDHVGSGKDWDLARKDGGLIMLPPFGDYGNDALYTSKLQALKGAINFLSRADEEYVVMCDCDIVSKINYLEILENHIAKKADITLVYTKVNGEDLGEDGTLTELIINKDKTVSGIAVKAHAEKRKMNMFVNVYVMKKTLLYNIIMDNVSRNRFMFLEQAISSNLDSMKVISYEHKGYLKRISSLLDYYNCNMDMLKFDIRNELFGDRSIFTKIRDSAPTKYGDKAVVKNSLIADGCVIEGTVENSIIFRNVKVDKGAVIKNSIVMQNTCIGEKSSLNAIITDKNVVIRDKVVLSGNEKHPFYVGKGLMI